MSRLMHLYAVAPGHAPKPANSAPTPIGSADRQQPTACATASRRFQQRSSQSKARRPANPPTQLSRPPGSDPTVALSRCAVSVRCGRPAWASMEYPTVPCGNRAKKMEKKIPYLYLQRFPHQCRVLSERTQHSSLSRKKNQADVRYPSAASTRYALPS